MGQSVESWVLNQVAHYFLERWRGSDDADRAARYQRLHGLYAPEARKVVEDMHSGAWHAIFRRHIHQGTIGIHKVEGLFSDGKWVIS